MPVANYEQYCGMLDNALKKGYAYPAINVSSMTTANAALKAFADMKSDGIIQVSTGGGKFASGQGVNDMVLGAILAFGPFLAVFFIGYGGPAATGALTFISVSLIIAAVRSDSGCEVMSIPAVFLRKHTHLCCIVFSPIDWVEKGLNNNL